MAPIHDAIRAFDVDALRRELAAGVSPELDVYADDPDEEEDICTPLYLAVVWGSAKPERNLEERVACVAALLEAGAAVNATNSSGTALHAAVQYEEFGDIVDLLIAADADVNAVDDDGESVIVTAAQFSGAAVVQKLISAGARDLDGALVRAVSNGRLRNCAPLLRAGAALPPEEQTDEILRLYSSNSTNPRRLSIIRARTYIAKIAGRMWRDWRLGSCQSWTPGDFKSYERIHCRRLTTVFANKFPTLPIDVISHIVLLWAHCGDYDYEDYLRVECNRVAALRRLRGGPRTE